MLFISAQQFGEQMQQSNPDLFEQLRGQAQDAVNQHRTQDESQDEHPKTGEKIPALSLQCAIGW